MASFFYDGTLQLSQKGLDIHTEKLNFLLNLSKESKHVMQSSEYIQLYDVPYLA